MKEIKKCSHYKWNDKMNLKKSFNISYSIFNMSYYD